MQWIVFGEDWGSHPSSTQHLFNQISQQDHVTWVNSLGLRTPRLTQHDIRRAYTKVKAMLNADCKPLASKQISAHSTYTPQHLIQPRTVPLFGSRLIRCFNRHQLGKQLQQIMNVNITPDQVSQATRSHPLPQVRTEDPRILWLSLPSAVDMIGHCDEDLSVYYCGDDFSSLAGVDHKVISRMEAELVERCDLIFTASEELAAKFPQEKTHLLEHGVDYRLFSAPQPAPENFPTGQVMGFYGQLADWVDIELLEQIADFFPDWTLMLIGAIHTDTHDLLNKENVICLDATPHEQLAAYCQHWQLALLPFKPCEQITHCNPLKLREYLATGTPVISLRFPAAEQYSDVITLADNRAEFLQQLDLLISQLGGLSAAQQQQLAIKQQALVQEDSWQYKAEYARDRIMEKLSQQIFNNSIPEQISTPICSKSP